MKTNFWKKSLTALLSLSMAFSAMSLPAFAATTYEKVAIDKIEASSEHANNKISLAMREHSGKQTGLVLTIHHLKATQLL